MAKEKYTEEMLRETVKNSNSFKDVLRNLGHRSPSGSMWQHIKKRIQKFNIDVLPDEPYSKRDDIIVITDEAIMSDMNKCHQKTIFTDDSFKFILCSSV